MTWGDGPGDHCQCVIPLAVGTCELNMKSTILLVVLLYVLTLPVLQVEDALAVDENNLSDKTKHTYTTMMLVMITRYFHYHMPATLLELLSLFASSKVTFVRIHVSSTTQSITLAGAPVLLLPVAL
jgi:hypothetical protein